VQSINICSIRLTYSKSVGFLHLAFGYRAYNTVCEVMSRGWTSRPLLRIRPQFVERKVRLVVNDRGVTDVYRPAAEWSSTVSK